MSGIGVTLIDHVSVLITDVERSRRFYRDVLGLKEIARPRTFDFTRRRGGAVATFLLLRAPGAPLADLLDVAEKLPHGREQRGAGAAEHRDGEEQPRARRQAKPEAGQDPEGGHPSTLRSRRILRAA